MKYLKIKSFELFAIAVFASSIFFISCDGKKESKEEKEEIVEMEMNSENDMETEMEMKEGEVKTRTYKMRDGATIIYNLDANGIAGFDDWADYTVVNYELAEVRNADFATAKMRISNMNYRIANLGNTIPSWLKTEEVMEDVADIQKEYKELIEDKDASESKMKENLEELNEKFDDLKQELDETVKKYTEIHKDAIEEYNEEIKKGKIEEAIEEYNEEMKKMDKIVEKKKQ